jgi:hypothetical protein
MGFIELVKADGTLTEAADNSRRRAWFQECARPLIDRVVRRRYTQKTEGQYFQFSFSVIKSTLEPVGGASL